ncbi:MAG: sigma-70 family RNA polymerase sigma factor [Spirochaetales bacterium]|nr:sigma-70 family RNA polymerase sigma factor [Spirochaetales bacterium]
MKRFEDVYDEYAERIYRFIYYKTYHRETAEDIMSQVFLKAFEKWDSFNPEKGPVSSWLYAIAGNLVIDNFRKKKPSANVDDIWDLSGSDDVQLDAERKEQLEEIRAGLGRLPSDQRNLIILRIWEDCSFREIAEITDKSEAGCKMQFYRAVKKLRSYISIALVFCLFSYLFGGDA